MTAAKCKRIAPGEYEMGGYEISHVEWPDEGTGYGATDHWVVTDTATGTVWDPFDTLREAKRAILEEG